MVPSSDLDLIRHYHIIDTPPEPVFDALAQRAAELFGATMAGISFFAPIEGAPQQSREWFKAAINLPARQLPSAHSFFLPGRQPRLQSARVFVIDDALSDQRFREHDWVSNAPYVSFFAGAAILTPKRECLGVLSVFDPVARQAQPQQLLALCNLADLVAARLLARAQQPRERPSSPVLRLLAGAQLESHTAALLTEEFIRIEQSLDDEIAERHSAERRLREEKEFSDAAIESLPGTFFMFDRNTNMVRWNASFQTISGYEREEIATRRVLDFIASHDRANVADAIRRIFERSEEIPVEADLRSKSGAEIPYGFQWRSLDLGGARYGIGVGRDISERLRAAREISHAKERLDLALVGSNLAIWDWDPLTNQVFFSEGWKETLGISPVDAAGVVFSGEQVIGWNHPEDQTRFEAALIAVVKQATHEIACEYRVPDGEGNWVWLQSKGRVTERSAGGRSIRITGTTANIHMRREAEARVEFLATRDPLTGLPNRALLNDRLALGIANAARKKTRLAFMFIDLDRFKTINDSLGHDVGDALLKQVAARLSACVRSSDTVARQGGDEFAVILENLTDDGHEAQQVAEKMVLSMAAPMMIDQQPLNTSCSIGIGVFPADGSDAQTLMKHADVAMYDAKAKGRNNYQFFSQAMNARAQQRLSIENYLRLALRRNELLVYYQPRVSFTSGEITAVEALLRWQHPRLGLLLPEKFIAVAEDSGLIVPIGEWLIATAFRQVAAWWPRLRPSFKLTLKLCAGQMQNGARLLQVIEEASTATGLELRQVEFDLTESALLKSGEETAAQLTRLGQLGAGLVIDDFGTGHSSLMTLKQLPVNAIKVDSSSLTGTAPSDLAIIRAIIAMSHSLNLKVHAEGVLRTEQFEALRALGCDEYQGPLFSEALPAADFAAQYLRD